MIFLWRDYCDWYVEMCKPSLQKGDAEDRQNAQAMLVQVLETALRLMHPIMPYITEVLWQALPKDSTAPASLMICDWPIFPEADLDDGAEATMTQLQQVVAAVRTIRSESNISPGNESSWFVVRRGRSG